MPGTAVFLTTAVDDVPPALLHNVKHHRALHERVVVLTVSFEQVPQVKAGIWRENLFSAMVRNAESVMEFFRLPTNRVLGLGSQLEI